MFTRQFVAGAATLTLLAAASSAQAQGRRFGAPDMMTLIQHEKIQAEVEVKDFQTEEIKKLSEQMDKDFPRPNFQNFFQLSPEEQTKARAEMQTQSEKKAAAVREKLGKVLLPPQMKRLGEIFVQAQGVGALRDAFVVKELGLSEDQVKQITAILQKSQDDSMKLFREAGGGGGGAPSPELMEKVGKIRADAEKESMAQLKEEQKKKLEEMKGKPFELPQFGPPGGGRGAGGGGGAGGGTKAGN